MNKKAEQFYDAMLKDMEYCRRKELGRGMELQCLFNVCNRYWAIVEGEVSNHVFETEDEEVFFFKSIKPKFVSEKLYCGLVGHARLFQENTTDKPALRRFWLKERKRLEKFRAKNYDFWEYYTSGRTDKDIEWFTRKNSEASTMHDGQVSTLLALEKYIWYVDKELELHGKNHSTTDG